MAAPRIQYAKTEDGLNVAFSESGSGPPVIYLPHGLPFSHLLMEWQVAPMREWYERLSRCCRLVRLDHRGAGLSAREVESYTLDRLCLDVMAVARTLKLERFALIGSWWSAATAIAFASMNPGMVSRLVLWHAVTRPSDIYSDVIRTTGETLIQSNWNFFAESLSHVSVGWDEGEAAHQAAEVIRHSAEPDRALIMWRGLFSSDVSRLVESVPVPVLVMHRSDFTGISLAASSDTAARLPDGRLVLFEGSSFAPFIGDSEGPFASIADFLGLNQAPMTGAGAFKTILFTDLADHTAMMQRLGDTRGREVLREHERITRETLARHGGTEVKAMGDGFMAAFGSAQRALECAIALQRAFDARGGAGADVEPIRLHVGVNAGEPIEEDDDLFGSSVILAARAASKARGGQILVTNVVRELVAGKGFVFADAGAFEMKGFDEPVRLYELQWQA